MATPTHQPDPPPTDGLLVRVKPRSGAAIRFSLDGHACDAHTGDTLLTAILLQRAHLQPREFSAGARAGFCLMGACQECWVRLADGTPLRACTTLVADGMAVVTMVRRDV